MSEIPLNPLKVKDRLPEVIYAFWGQLWEKWLASQWEEIMKRDEGRIETSGKQSTSLPAF